ncbi:YlzJ-like family protein [Evansella cellulosilytica]|uniref:Uncharacterized protein n=1 Tax=Evansella cellulosilytica (strain ATCC 21833 / DSM 2522 / FERM P-1141 / JCM 9156 / N-4) TaxID=649639 RepID=E6TS43_EVAC2|nr:YlzJ-like family protein [Evansella cellulosilytica]ADU30697.1 hypothetical protein Bcell_2440 [Evansella cellulosilytica DSM 2522]
MILYTYQSQEMIFPINEADYTNQTYVDIPGGQLQLEKVEEGQGGLGSYRIVRLLSSDPNLYLNPQYAPGQVFSVSK